MSEKTTVNTGHQTITVVGAGLAGSECAWQLAELGHKVTLIEMRSLRSSPAHRTDHFAELVCSNSLGSQTDYSAPGQLKWEAAQLNCLILKAAQEASVPAGMALGVDRELFAKNITLALTQHPNVQVERRIIENLEEVPRPAVICTGPLTDTNLANSMKAHLAESTDEEDFLYFFDAIAPIIDVDTINMDICWKGDRYDKGTNDYLNCPLDKDQYFALVDAINKSRKIEPKEFEKTPYFDGCMPIEAIAERGPLTLKHGPMSPNGLRNPRTGIRPFAVVQLRQENREATAYNMVGFQTKMAYGDQKEVFRMIPGLEDAEFLKLGSMHRNLYIHSPKKLSPILASKKDPWLHFAGQITGVEGYFDSTCIGLLVARILHDRLLGREPQLPPRATAFGSLLNAITEPTKHFQPTNINFSLFPVPNEIKKGRNFREAKRDMQLQIAKNAFVEWQNAVNDTVVGTS